jgi:AbiV family abortive infection protein
LAEGLAVIHKNAARLAQGMETLKAVGNVRAAQVLASLASEESAKYLILLDAARCPRHPSGQLVKHLNKAYEHLAKGIYTDACSWRTMEYTHISEAIERSRPDHYLDGPNGNDWIFRNSIVALREEIFYVDYVSDSDGHRLWWSPERFDTLSPTFIDVRAFRVIEALQALGFGTVQGLQTVAGIWRPVPVDESLGWHRVLDLNHETLLALDARDDPNARLIAGHWPYPMYPFDMRPMPVKQSELRRIQAEYPVDRW